MNNVIKWGLILGGAYFLYEEFIAAPAAAAAAGGSTSTGSTTSTGGSTSTTTTTAATCPPFTPPKITCDTVPVQTSKLLAAAIAGGNGSASAPPSLTASQWNYYYNSVYSTSPNTPAWSLNDDGSPMTLGAYMTLRSSLGFSGLGAIAGRIPLPVPFVCPKGALCAQRPGRPTVVMMPNRTINYVPAGTSMLGKVS